MMKQKILAAFGRIPCIIHTDHANITRLDHLPLHRIDAKHLRWYNELVQDGSLLLYRFGAGSLHSLPDALSRNPCKREELNLARTGDWVLYRQAIRGVQKAIDDVRFSDENPPEYTEQDVEDELKEFSKFERDPEEGETGADEILRLSMPFNGVDDKDIQEGLSVIREEKILAVLGGAAASQSEARSSLLLVLDRTEHERFLGIWQRIQGSGPIEWLPSWPKKIPKAEIEELLTVLRQATWPTNVSRRRYARRRAVYFSNGPRAS